MNDRYLNRMKSYIMSFMYPILIAIPISPVILWFEKYVFNDWEFVKFLVVLMIIDTVLGFVFHFKKRDFSVEGFEKIFIKLLCYGAALIVAHNLSSFTINGDIIQSFTWFRVLICTALMVREGLSIFKIIDKLSPSLVSPRIKKYLKYYDETGEFPRDNFVDNNKNREQ